MLLFINFQVTTDTFVVSPTPRRVLLLSLAATTSERGFGIAKEYRTTTTNTEYKWKKECKKSKRKKKKTKKRSEEEWAANAALVTCHRHCSWDRY